MLVNVLLIGFGEDGERGSTEAGTVSPYDEAMDALSSLITQKTRADKTNSGHRFELLFDYVKVDIRFGICNYCNQHS